MGSTRMPGKVMLKACGRTMLGHVLSRVSACSVVDEIIVATTKKEEDDVIVKECDCWGVRYYRGDELNVLQRYYEAALEAKTDTVVRVTSDCPVIDPDILSELIGRFYSENTAPKTTDYMRNEMYPLGLNAEIFTFAALEKSYREASKDYEFEHVTPYIYLHPEQFVIKSIMSAIDYTSYRWTLDTKEDYELIGKIFSYLYEENALFGMKDILRLMDQFPELKQINSHIRQKRLGE
jgi:spore coat polysaccharide biosynthesis protein SpsF